MQDWHVICLCAEWCGVCRQWEPVFDALATERPDAAFAWVDVEDEDEAMGDVEVETFPTLLIAHRGRALFLGPVQPSPSQVSRLLAGLQAQAQQGDGSSAQAQSLYERLLRGPLSSRAV
jgi:thioredoxin 1